jgi:hypothetical protein
MAASWPQSVTNSFLSANYASDVHNDESAHNGSYTRLLYHLFDLPSPFDITFQHSTPQTPQTITVGLRKYPALRRYPMLFIQIRPPSSFHVDSKRKQADDQIRDHCCELSANLITPRLHAISVFGPRIAFYEYTATTNAVTPPAIVADPVPLNDTARWNYNVLEAGGIARIRQVVQDVWTMCEGLTTELSDPVA